MSQYQSQRSFCLVYSETIFELGCMGTIIPIPGFSGFVLGRSGNAGRERKGARDENGDSPANDIPVLCSCVQFCEKWQLVFQSCRRAIWDATWPKRQWGYLNTKKATEVALYVFQDYLKEKRERDHGRKGLQRCWDSSTITLARRRLRKIILKNKLSSRMITEQLLNSVITKSRDL